MTRPVLEPRSFQPVSMAPRLGREAGPGAARQPAWGEETAWDAITSRALIHRVRWHTGLSQSEFASAYDIDLDHLRALERGAVQPDRALVAYLTVIDRAPDAVRAALAVG